MANEISISTGLQVSNGASVRPSNAQTKSQDQAAIGISETTIAVTTSDLEITLALTTPGWVQLLNVGSNIIQWGPDNSGAILPLGELDVNGPPAQFKLISTVTKLRVRTTAGTSTLSLLLIKR